jgi:hypothetical protein
MLVSKGSEGRGVAVVVVVPAYLSKCDDSRSACDCFLEGGQTNQRLYVKQMQVTKCGAEVSPFLRLVRQMGRRQVLTEAGRFCLFLSMEWFLMTE